MIKQKKSLLTQTKNPYQYNTPSARETQAPDPKKALILRDKLREIVDCPRNLSPPRIPDWSLCEVCGDDATAQHRCWDKMLYQEVSICP